MHDTLTLRAVCQKDPMMAAQFLDVYGADQVPCQPTTNQYPRCAILNTDPIRHPSQHWVAVYWTSPTSGEFFDSCAEQPSSLVQRWRCFDHFTQIPHALQAWNSDICGDYCLYYLYKRCRGVPLAKIVSNFHWSDLQYNDQAVLERMHDLFPRPLKVETHPDTPRQYCILRALSSIKRELTNGKNRVV